MKGDEHISPYYPVFLKIAGKKCLVVGGGNVALRKVRTLIEHGAAIKLVSPVLCPQLSKLAEDGVIQVQLRPYKTEDLNGAFIVVAATDDAATNKRIATEAKRRGVLVNIADSPQNSDFIVPAYFKRGNVTVAVSTSGKSPALARKIRSELEKDFTAEYAQLASLIHEVRSELKQQRASVGSDIWQEVVSSNSLLELLKQGKSQEAKETMLRKLKASERKKS